MVKSLWKSWIYWRGLIEANAVVKILKKFGIESDKILEVGVSIDISPKLIQYAIDNAKREGVENSTKLILCDAKKWLNVLKMRNHSKQYTSHLVQLLDIMMKM